ncbi:YkvA family protein [Leptothoe sp. PORK10 BA2]|uniref:YkvA family protein n=1 Tax=Leptothoe sp. PORK10 BA2 TaxID=3110254 RepID=UPI002B2126F3|nr:YkvA family protein [Leptothoe sp. PORK10 BA2]MEA5462270.1 YkvA family protein [Leptothoe sp. PORK10 BA2]
MKTSAQQSIIEGLRNWYRNAIRNSKYRWIVVFGSLLYLVSPFDISPDVLPIIGWLDDGIIATLLVTEVSQLLFEQVNASKKKANKETTQKADATANTATATEQVVDVQAVSVS